MDRLLERVRGILWLSVLLLALPSVASAEDGGDREARVIALEARVLELEERQGHGPSEDNGSVMSQFGRGLGAFGDMNYLSRSREKHNPTFSIGSLGLYSTASYPDSRLNFLFEMIIVAHNSRTSVNLERLWAGYTVNDALILRAGRFHTAMGYWNKNFHHGRHFFPTVDRPFFLKFEDIGGVIPAHIVGLEVDGTMKAAFGKVKYWAQFGNGPGVTLDVHTRNVKYQLKPNNLFDNNEGKQFVGRLSIEPTFINKISDVSSLKLGVFGTNFLLEDRRSTFTTHETIYGADIYLSLKPLEFIGEYFRFENNDDLGEAFYTQLSYNLERYTFFARFERLLSETNDPYLSILTGGKDRRQSIAGIRYDLDYLHSAFKAQYRRDEVDLGEDFDVFEVQWSFHF